jgi:hypothetical protein
MEQHDERSLAAAFAVLTAGKAHAGTCNAYVFHVVRRPCSFVAASREDLSSKIGASLRFARIYCASMKPLAVAERAIAWVRNHPEDLIGAALDAVGLKLTVPLDALRFLVSRMNGKNAPEDLEIVAVPPGLRVGATVTAMKTRLRASGTLLVDEMRVGPSELRFAVRLRHVSLAVLGKSDSPVATLVNSGALDLSRPGKLVASLPKRPPFVVEADGDRLVIDLMRDPKLARRVGRVAAIVTPLLTVTSVESKGDALTLQLACLPDGFGAAVDSIRAAIERLPLR